MLWGRSVEDDNLEKMKMWGRSPLSLQRKSEGGEARIRETTEKSTHDVRMTIEKDVPEYSAFIKGLNIGIDILFDIFTPCSSLIDISFDYINAH